MASFGVKDKAVALLGGIAVVMYLTAIALTPAQAPDSGSAGGEIVQWATDHRGQLLASYMLFALGLAVLVVFAAGLYRVVRRAEGEDGWLAMASLASAVAGAGIFGAGTALFMAVVYRPDTDPAVARALWDAGWLAYNTAGFGFSAWIAIVAVATLRYRLLPVWTAWIGIPVALIGLVGPFAVKAGTGPFSPQGWFALVVGFTFGAWLLAVSLATWRSARVPAMTAESERLMRQLTSLDAQFLAAEDGKTHGHVSSLGIYDPSTAPGGKLTLDAVRDLVAGRIHLLPPFRWRLAEVPFGLDHPYWFDDPDFDLDFHIRELALPAPGDQRMLAEQVARIVARPLDRARPLWEFYLIHGLADERVAVLTKLHHAAVDGVSGAEILSVLLDPAPEGRTVDAPEAPRTPARMPGQLQMLGRGVAALPMQPLRSLRSLPKALPHLDQVPTVRSLPGVATLAAASRRAARTMPRTSDGGVLEGPRLRAPITRMNRHVSPHRRVALSRQSLADVKRVKNHFGVTVNDVVVAICAGALRSWLDARGELPDEPLLGMVPVSVRTPEQRGTFGNRVATMLAPIPTHLGDPRARLRAAHEAMRSAKERHKAVPATVLQDANRVIPPALFARAARVTTSVALRHPSEAMVNTVISNVPGSPEPLYLSGARLEALYPISGVMHGIGLNITVMSYCGELFFGIVADRDLVADPRPLAEELRRAQDELLALVDIPVAAA